MQTKELEKLADVINIDETKHAVLGDLSQAQVDETDYTVFKLVDENAVYKISESSDGIDFRWDFKFDATDELPDYSGPFRHDLRFTDFSDEALIKLLWLSYEYFVLVMKSTAEEVASRKGADMMREIQAATWNQINLMTPSIIKEWNGFAVKEMPKTDSADVIAFNPFKPDTRYSTCGKEQLVKMALGSQEFMNTAIGAWSVQIITRYGHDEMCSILLAMWGSKVLPGVRSLKIKWMNVEGGDSTPVEAFTKDIQIDTTSFPGKAYEMTFEMPDRNTSLIAFIKCCVVEQGEEHGRDDIIKKTCHSTCPLSMIETAKMYDPNMKVEFLALPPRKSKEDVCCMYRLSMRDKSDPEYVVQ